MPITGQTLKDMGYTPGPWFKAAIAAAEDVRRRGGDEAALRRAVEACAPPPTVPLRPLGGLKFTSNIRAAHPDEIDNVASVERHMAELMRCLLYTSPSPRD